MKMSELEKARRVIAKHEKEEAEKKRLKPGEVRYVTWDGGTGAEVFHVRPFAATWAPAAIRERLTALLREPPPYNPLLDPVLNNDHGAHEELPL